MHYTYPLLYVILYLDYQPNIKEMCALATVIVTVKTQPMRTSCTASKGASRRTRLSDRMAPMTRSRATAEGDLVTDLHVEYYRQRASAGAGAAVAVAVAWIGCCTCSCTLA